MVAFVIFWVALFAVICYILGTIFKALASMFNAFFTSFEKLIQWLVSAGLMIVILWFIWYTIDSFFNGGLLHVLYFLFCFSIVGGIAFTVGSIALTITGYVMIIVMMFCFAATSYIAQIFETGYVKSLKIIMNNVEKC